MYKDKEGTTVKIGDNLITDKGKVYKLMNINGVAFAVNYGEDRVEILGAIVLTKFNFEEARKI